MNFGSKRGGFSINDNVTLATKISKIVAEKGGSTYYIGGCVRDRIQKKEIKDIDIEVHGIFPDQLEKILDSIGERISIGESFGIYSVKGYSLDIAMPRKEKNRGVGHRDFDICIDPFIGTYKAALRRDFTINTLMQNVLTGEIIDHFNGVRDIQNKIIRHVNMASFKEDPLRVLRAAQFSARFNYSVADDTIELCKTMDLSTLPKERIMGELEKALLKSDKPSIFFEVLREMNQLNEWFPELEKLIGVQQNPKYHAEGDVWVHTMMVTDAAIKLKYKTTNPLGFMLSAVTHDFGKALCTKAKNGEIHAYMHETLGLPLIENFLRRLTSEKYLIRYVLNLAKHHMDPTRYAADKSSIKSTNKMFDQSVDPEALICIAIADNLGKVTLQECVPHDDFFYKRLSIYKEYMSRPYVQGRDLIDAGLVPSERFSEYLGFARKLRLAGIKKENALRQTLALARKKGEYEGPNNKKTS